MIYGLYLSAAGVMASSHRQDVVANNLANGETTGFKRDLALFMQRPTEAQTRAGGAGSPSALGPVEPGAGPGPTNPVLEGLGGGVLVSPTRTDFSQGDLESTGNPMDLALMGKGFLAVESGGKQYLTRAGHLAVDSDGTLVLANGRHDHVLDKDLKPITVDPAARFGVDKGGTITQDEKPTVKLALLDVPDTDALKKVGSDLFAAGDLAALQPPTDETRVETGALERSNADPTLELTHLMDAQRSLEANANMIRYQDETLQRLVNDVGKIG